MSNKAENNNVENAVVEIIKKAIQGIDSTTEFLLSEIPEVIQQLLMWYFAKSLIISLVLLVSVVVSLYFGLKLLRGGFIKLLPELHNSRFSICCGLAFFAAINFHELLYNNDWLMIWIAPKAWLIEYAANLAK